jgi:hypothetical protein
MTGKKTFFFTFCTQSSTDFSVAEQNLTYSYSKDVASGPYVKILRSNLTLPVFVKKTDQVYVRITSHTPAAIVK